MTRETSSWRKPWPPYLLIWIIARGGLFIVLLSFEDDSCTITGDFFNQSKLRSAFEDAPSFTDMRLLNVWRVAQRIGGRLVTFPFPTAAKEAEGL
jgi:hypothetical protein